MNQIYVPNRGQSLIELLIGVAIAVVLLGSAAALIATTLRVGRENQFLQTAWFVNQAGMNLATTFAGIGWYLLDEVRVFPDYFAIDLQACLDSGGSSCVPIVCDPILLATVSNVAVDGVPYYVCYNVDEVYRTSDDRIVPAGTPGAVEDRSTFKILVKTFWGPQAQFETAPLEKYVTRYDGDVFRQTDWSGGGGQPGLWSVQSKFGAASPDLEFSTPGEITIAP